MAGSGDTEDDGGLDDASNVLLLGSSSESRVGIELSDLLSTPNASGEAGTALCFDSLTALLEHTDLQQAFRFLHVVTDRVESAGAAGHDHTDPDAHDRQTLATLKGLFDVVVTVDEDGARSVER